jgi:hypothetical protein
MCVCVYIYIYICIHTRTHTYIHTYIHTHTYTHTHIYTYTHIHIHTYTHTHPSPWPWNASTLYTVVFYAICLSASVQFLAVTKRWLEIYETRRKTFIKYGDFIWLPCGLHSGFVMLVCWQSRNRSALSGTGAVPYFLVFWYRLQVLTVRLFIWLSFWVFFTTHSKDLSRRFLGTYCLHLQGDVVWLNVRWSVGRKECVCHVVCK